MDDPSFATLLRTWRDRRSPVDVGITSTTNRRAPGLRREELAQLVGLSVDYVLRLEQGRATNPSPQVVGALARGLQLSRVERDQLYLSAGLLPPQDGTVATHVPASIQRLAGRLSDSPIGVFAADWTLLWCNDLWKALHGDPAALPPGQRNMLQAVFGTGAAQAAVHPTRSANGARAFEAALVADLKVTAARYPADPRLRALITELLATCQGFASLWESVTAAVHVTDRKTIHHPVVGKIALDCDVLSAPGADLRLVAYTAPAHSADAGRLDLLRVTGGQRLGTTT